MNKHAYLIMAHDNFEQLVILINELDYIDNDIFLHVDKKNDKLRKEIILFFEKNNLKYSRLTIVNSISVHWGGFSQIKTEMLLIEEAMKKQEYSRLHLLSAVDFPIKSQKYIHNYFDKVPKTEFIMFDYNRDDDTIMNRIRFYHPFIDKVSRNNKLAMKIENVFIGIQKIFKVNRIRKQNKCFMKGANWFSITGDLAKFIINNKKEIEKTFKNTKCCDEIFLQTLVYNSNYKDNLYFDLNDNRYHNLRYIDWKRGNPYVFKEKDFIDLKESHYLFARKFDIRVDKKILELIKKNNKETIK